MPILARTESKHRNSLARILDLTSFESRLSAILFGKECAALGRNPKNVNRCLLWSSASEAERELRRRNDYEISRKRVSTCVAEILSQCGFNVDLEQSLSRARQGGNRRICRGMHRDRLTGSYANANIESSGTSANRACVSDRHQRCRSQCGLHYRAKRLSVRRS